MPQVVLDEILCLLSFDRAGSGEAASEAGTLRRSSSHLSMLSTETLSGSSSGRSLRSSHHALFEVTCRLLYEQSPRAVVPFIRFTVEARGDRSAPQRFSA